jgi:hypothetical protein
MEMKFYTPNNIRATFCTNFGVRVVLLIEDPTVTVKCRTAMVVLFACFSLHPNVK